MKPSEMIGPADRERIEAAVRTAESGTSGEIVVSVVGRCGRYSAAGWRLGVALAGLALLGSAYLPREAILLEMLALQLFALVAGHALVRIDALRRAFVPAGELVEKAELAAVHAFHGEGIRETRGRTGILVFVALFEHRVIVLADEAIDAVLDPSERWQEIVDLVLEGIRDGRITDGIEAGVARCGEILSHPLPPRPDDEDEIPRGLVLSD